MKVNLDFFVRFRWTFFIIALIFTGLESEGYMESAEVPGLFFLCLFLFGIILRRSSPKGREGIREERRKREEKAWFSWPWLILFLCLGVIPGIIYLWIRWPEKR